MKNHGTVCSFYKKSLFNDANRTTVLVYFPSFCIDNFRFAPGLSPSPSFKKAIKTPLPASDDSDQFYSPDDSLNRGKLSDVHERVVAKASPVDDALHEDSLMLGTGSWSRPGMRLSPAPEPGPTSSFLPQLQDVSQDQHVPQDKDSVSGDSVDDKESAAAEDEKEEEMPEDESSDHTSVTEDDEDEEMSEDEGSNGTSDSVDDEESASVEEDHGEVMLLDNEGDRMSDSVDGKENIKAEEDRETAFLAEKVEDVPVVGSSLM